MKRIPILLLLLLSPLLDAQEIKAFKGDFETNVSALVNRGEIDLNLRLGAFTADFLQFGADVGYSDTNFLTQYELGVYGVRFIDTGTYTLPYVGLGLGYVSLEGDADEGNAGISTSLILGIRYYIADNVALNTEFRSAWASDKAFVDNDQAVDTQFSLGVGISYLW
jgi:opacity protein-like surface antigen